MVANLIIGLREGLEAALVVSILVAFLVRTDRRDMLRWVWLGVGIAVAVSLSVGALLYFGSRGLTFTAQEAIGGTLSIIAVGFVTWMVFWMRKAARHLRSELDGRMETALSIGTGAVVATAMLAVGREGLETALFIWAAVKATGNTADSLVGAALGIALAILLAYLLYKGSVRINLATFFKWTGAALIVVAAGVLAYGVHDLQEANILPGLNSLAFDISTWLPPTSWYGSLLKGTINLSPQTTWLQAIVWVAYIAPVMFLYFRRPRAVPARAAQTATA